jgi:ribosomal-protein-alanine N-acetyltransferase
MYCGKYEKSIFVDRIVIMLFINLQTNRLLLKNIGNEDREFIFNHFSDENVDVNQYLYDAETCKNISDADEIINFYLKPEPRNQHRWIIINKTNDIKMGTCGFHCWDIENSKVEIGYDLSKHFWGNGYMNEALVEIITFSERTMKIKEIIANIYHGNNKSISVMEKLGFKLTGTKDYLFRGKDYRHKIYSLYKNNDC